MVGKIVDYASGFIQDRLVDENQDSIDQKATKQRIKELKERKSKGNELNDEDEKFLNKFENTFKTFAQQISGNSKDYMISFAHLATR